MTSLTPVSMFDAQAEVLGQRLSRQPEAEQRLAAAQQFEAMLLRKILKDALKPMEGGLLDGPGGSETRQMTQDLMADTLAQALVQGGGLGLAEEIARGLPSSPGTTMTHAATTLPGTTPSAKTAPLRSE